MTYLLDTCIIADLVSAHPDQKLIRWIDSQPEVMMYISVVTLAEIKQAIECVEPAKKRAQMNDWLKNKLLSRFEGRISEITVEATMKWGELPATVHAYSQKINPINTLNLIIAMINDHTLVTRNTSTFKGMGVRVLNPYAVENE
jgi:toxin FitB